jgi:hypothetical protein
MNGHDADAVVDGCFEAIGFEDLLYDLALIGVKVEAALAGGWLEQNAWAKVCGAAASGIGFNESIFVAAGGILTHLAQVFRDLNVVGVKLSRMLERNPFSPCISKEPGLCRLLDEHSDEVAASQLGSQAIVSV